MRGFVGIKTKNMKTTFLVKDGSANLFFKDIKLVDRRDIQHNSREDQNPYSLMRDKLIVPKSKIPENTSTVVFELKDESVNSRTSLMNIYTYTVLSYDDISYLLELSSFGIHMSHEK